MNRRNKVVRWFILALALAAFSATAAQAGTKPKDRAGTLGVGSQRTARDSSDVVTRYLRSHSIRPNDGVGLAATSVAASGGFRWSDYGAGVGTGIVVVLLLAGGLPATPMGRRQRSQPAIGR